jgi:hypothetical protein
LLLAVAAVCLRQLVQEAELLLVLLHWHPWKTPRP